MFYKLCCLHDTQLQNLGNFSPRLSCLLAYIGLNPPTWLNPTGVGKSCCMGEEADWTGWAVHHGFEVVSIPFQKEVVFLASPLLVGQQP